MMAFQENIFVSGSSGPSPRRMKHDKGDESHDEERVSNLDRKKT